MSKKIILLIIFAVFMIIPADKINAAQYFIGVTIASGSAPGFATTGTSLTDNNWCLPNGTDFYIRNNSGIALPVCSTTQTTSCYVSPTTNPTRLSGPACAGKTVWSPLVDISDEIQYQLYFDLADGPRSYCPGWATGGICFVSEPVEGYDCCQTCAYYNLEEYSTNTSCSSSSNSCLWGTYAYGTSGSNNPYNPGVFNNCAIESFLMGGQCSSCTTGAAYGYYNTSTYACFTPHAYSTDGNNQGTFTGNSSCATLAGSNLVRVCACDVQSSPCCEADYYPTFIFNFIPSF